MAQFLELLSNFLINVFDFNTRNGTQNFSEIEEMSIQRLVNLTWNSNKKKKRKTYFGEIFYLN